MSDEPMSRAEKKVLEEFAKELAEESSGTDGECERHNLRWWDGPDDCPACIAERQYGELREAAITALQHYHQVDDEFTDSYEVDADYNIVNDGQGKWRLTAKYIAERKLAALLEQP